VGEAPRQAGRRARPASRQASPGLAASFRAAAFDFYYQSIRLVPANLLWGLSFLAWLLIAIATGPLVTLLTAPLLAVPWVGLVRLAALTARGRDVVLSDVVAAVRSYGLQALLAGAVAVLAVVVLASNVIVGANLGGPLGWLLSTFAGAGLVVLSVLTVPFWPILVDPEREDMPALARARLAALVVVAAPGRLAWLAFLLLVLLLVSTVAFVAVLTIAPAYASLVAARYTLPLSDRLERWLADRGAGAT
jgi:hypothetical protein